MNDRGVERPLAAASYPCHYARQALTAGSLDVIGVSSASWADLPRHFAEKLVSSAANDGRRHAYVIVADVSLSGTTFEDHEAMFWSILQHLHDWDREPWPDEISRDPHSARFAFCFQGFPMYVFGCSPAYRRRRSRTLGEAMAVVAVPHHSFFGIRLGTPAGAAARRQIRKRVELLDDCPPAEEFGGTDVSEVVAWPGYWLPEIGDVDRHVVCPLRI